jgi:hypothetical protein
VHTIIQQGYNCLKVLKKSCLYKHLAVLPKPLTLFKIPHCDFVPAFAARLLLPTARTFSAIAAPVRALTARWRTWLYYTTM